MNKLINKTVVPPLVALFMSLFFFNAAMASELVGTITGTKEDIIYINMSSKKLPQKGDPIRITWELDGEAMEVGRAEVMEVDGGQVKAKVLEGNPAIDMKVIISSTQRVDKKEDKKEIPEYMVSYKKCYQEKNRDFALKHCNRALRSGALTNKMLVTTYFNRASLYSNKGDYDRAISDYSSAIKISPNDHELWYERGRNYRFKKNYDLAIKDLTRAITLKPDYHGAYNNRGLAYRNLGKYNEAIRDYNRAVSLKPEYDIYYSNRGYAYFKMGKFIQALEDHDRAIRIDPSNGNSFANRGDTYDVMGKKKEALKDWKRAYDLGHKTEKIRKKLREARIIK